MCFIESDAFPAGCMDAAGCMDVWMQLDVWMQGYQVSAPLPEVPSEGLRTATGLLNPVLCV